MTLSYLTWLIQIKFIRHYKLFLNEDMIVAVVIAIQPLANKSEKKSGTSTGFEPMTSTLALQFSNQLSHEDP